MGSGSIVVLGSATTANVLLVAGLERLGLEAELAPLREARSRVREGDVAIVRADVLPSLDGVEEGLLELLWLERSGARVVNSVRSLLAVHDKLRTMRILAAAGLPQPRTLHAVDARAVAAAEPPVVIKPRFGSWGRDVFRCRDGEELEHCLRAIRGRSWFRRHGALVQELLPSPGRDLRIVVAGGKVVGAAERTAAPGEWRTNVSLGGTHRAAVPTPETCDLAVAAAAATGTGLVGVDLFPSPGGWVILELNGAVEFDDVYSQPGRDIYADLVEALALDGAAAPRRQAAVRSATSP